MGVGDRAGRDGGVSQLGPYEEVGEYACHRCGGLIDEEVDVPLAIVAETEMSLI